MGELDRTGGLIVPGLISVTFRQLDVADIARLAAECGLRGVEWGADVHVPPGDLEAADRAVKCSADRGLTITGYGSYFRAGVDAPSSFDPIVDTAAALGAPTVRIWAGGQGSAHTTPAGGERVQDGIADAVARGTDAGIDVALEFHAGTLTDTAAGARELCEATGARSHWQPRVGASDAEALDDLDVLVPHLSAAHIFSWAADGRRLPLSARADLWRAALARLHRLRGDHPALLEFVADDDPESLRRDAETFRRLLAEAGT